MMFPHGLGTMCTACARTGPRLVVRVTTTLGHLLLFFLQVFAAIVRHVDWDIVRCLVIAGPGFAKDEFREYLDKGGPPIGCTS